MGQWITEKNLHGERERWVPSFSSEWPPYDQGSYTVLPVPCNRCIGIVVRRLRVVNQYEITQVERINARRATEAAQRGTTPEFMASPVPITVWSYDLEHHARCVGAQREEATEPVAKVERTGRQE